MNRPRAWRVRLNRPPNVRHAKLIAWVAEMAALTEARDVYWCDGSDAEYDRLCAQLVAAGTLHEAQPRAAPEQLSRAQQPERRRPGRRPHLHLLGTQGRRRPDQQLDGARPRCARCCRPAWPTARRRSFAAAMRGRTMYVVPFSMGPLGSDIAHIGVELTDSAYVAVSMKIMTRMGARCSTCSAPTATSCPACTRSARRSSPARRTWPGRATRPSTSSTIPRRRRSGATARATAATPCSARSASRCASPR